MIDRLIDRIRTLENPTVVGLDPTLEMIPAFIRNEMRERYGKTAKAVAEMFLSFNRGIIDAIWDLVPAVKPQIAMYEQYGFEGIRAYQETAAYAKGKGLLIVGDIKRGDIASTAAAYASHIGGIEIEGEHLDPWQEDSVTVNPYLGTDGIEPFLEILRRQDRSIFVLVKTSNPSSGELQDRMLEGEELYLRVADLVDGWGQPFLGKYGYSRVGAVVGATHPAQGAALRKRLPHTFFLVPGYGAQGAAGKDLKGFFDSDGMGCLVNSSRGIIGAYQKDTEFGDPGEVGPEFAQASRKAVLAMKADLNNAL